MEFSCKRCGHVSSTKSNLLKHLRRKTPCEPTVENVSIVDLLAEVTHREYNEHTWNCEHCERRFNSYQNRWRHMKTCKSVPTPASLTDEIQQLRARIDELEKNRGGNNITNNNNTNNTQNNQNIHIHLRDFGQEDLSYLPNEFLSRCFVEKDIVRLLENIHCDQEHPENQNIRVKSQKRNQIETRENNRWKIKDEDEALTECIQNGYRILVRHGFRKKKEIIEEELDFNEDEYHSIRDWLEGMYNDRKEQKPIKRQLLLLFLNNQALILGKDVE